MSRIWSFSLCLLAGVAFAAASQAATLTLDDCDSEGCRGADLTMSVDLQNDGSYLVTYTVNTDALNTGGGNFIGFNQLNFLSIKDWNTAELIYAPNGVENWSDPIEAVVSSNGSLCAPGGTTDMVCIYAKNDFLDMSGGGDYTWKFRLTGSVVLDTSEWHFGAQWSDEVGPARGNQISASAPPVPEPSAALLFGVGTLTVGGALRRSQRRA